MSSKTSGDWLYQKTIISWLYKPTLRQQLPLLYRLFGLYCWLQRNSHSPKIKGGRTVFRTIVRLSTALNTHYTSLHLGSRTVFLNLLDPRMLQVPNELQPKYPDTSVLQVFLAEGDTFLDVGANHGSFSIVAAGLLGQTGKIVAVEPQPQLANLLEKSLAANARCPYEIHRVACGDRNDTITFYIPHDSSGSAGIFPEFSAQSGEQELSVPLKRFDELVNWRDFPGQVFLKLDVEGSELLFFKGAIEMIRARKPSILLEINPGSMQAAAVDADTLIQQLQTLGYEEFVEIAQPQHRKPLSTLETKPQRNIIVVPPLVN
jgi:FkbM family methyltransferase